MVKTHSPYWTDAQEYWYCFYFRDKRLPQETSTCLEYVNNVKIDPHLDYYVNTETDLLFSVSVRILIWFSVTFCLLPETRHAYAVFDFFVRHYWLMALNWWASWEKMCRIISATRTVLALTGQILSKFPWIRANKQVVVVATLFPAKRYSRPRKEICRARSARIARGSLLPALPFLGF